jgi:tRNA-dihydrouridine synthase B
MGAALTFSEMVSGKGLMYGNKNTEDLLYIRPEERAVGFQIFGREPDVMEWTARKLAGRDNVLIDINMGCPVPKIVKNGEGSALMKEPELAGEIVRAVVRGAACGAQAEADGESSAEAKPVTVKMRAGWDDDHINAVEVALACEEAGAAAVTIHGRTRNQYYSGKANRDIIRRVKKELSIPVIGNGDIFTAEDAVRMMDETGCDGVMIARGALGNPWIFREAKALWEGKPVPARPGPDEIYEMMRRHFQMLMEDKGERRAVFEMRKHVGWYMKGQPHAAELRRRINTITTAEELMAALDKC